MKKVLLLTFALFANFAFAQFSNDPAINLIVRDSAGPEEVVPICGMHPMYGTTFVSWFNQNASSSYDFSMQAMSFDGYKSLPASGLTVSNYPQNSAIYVYDTKVDHNNEMVSAFQDERTGVLDIVTYKMSAGGLFQWGNAGISLTDSAASGGIAPNVGILSTNDVVVAWIADGTPKDWIAFQRISSAGSTAWSTPHRIIDSTNVAGYSRPQIVPMLNDDFFILYIKQTGSGLPASTMFMQRYDSAGMPVWNSPVQISSKLIGFAAYPSVVPDGANGAYIAYSSGNPNNASFNDVYVQHIDENGTLWSADGTEACTSALTQRMSPKIRFENNMVNPMVLIKETDGSQGSAGVTVQSFDATGNRLLGPDGFAVTPITASYDEPYDMRALGSGMVILYAEGLFGNQQLFATRIDFSGAPQWSPATLAVSTFLSNKSRGQLTPATSIIDVGDEVVAVWEDDVLDAGIYSQNINANGTLGILTNITNPIRTTFDATIYPNPGINFQRLAINSEIDDEIIITLYNSNGQLVNKSMMMKISKGKNELVLNTLFNQSKIAAGNYSLSIHGKKSSARIQLIVE